MLAHHMTLTSSSLLRKESYVFYLTWHFSAARIPLPHRSHTILILMWTMNPPLFANKLISVLFSKLHLNNTHKSNRSSLVGGCLNHADIYREQVKVIISRFSFNLEHSLWHVKHLRKKEKKGDETSKTHLQLPLIAEENETEIFNTVTLSCGHFFLLVLTRIQPSDSTLDYTFSCCTPPCPFIYSLQKL